MPSSRDSLPKKPKLVQKTPVVLPILPQASLLLLIEFVPENYLTLRQINKTYKLRVAEAIDEMVNGIENKFVVTYLDTLFFRRSYSWFRKIRVCG
jgi:hypothetical protein